MQNFETAQQQLLSGSKTATGLASRPASKSAQAQASKSAQAATQAQQLQAAPKVVPKAKPATNGVESVPQASSSQSAVPKQPTTSNGPAKAAPSPSLVTSTALPLQPVKSLQLTKAGSKPSPQHTQAQASLSKADAVRATATERTSATQAKASQAAAATVADEWAEKGVPVQSGYLQSGYQMADSPLPEEEELVSECETSRPPSAERQQADSAHPAHASAQISVAKAAATTKGAVPVPSVAPASDRAQDSSNPLQEKIVIPAGKDTAEALSSRVAQPSSAATNNLLKQPPNRQSSSAAAGGRTTALPAGPARPTAGKSPLTGRKEPLGVSGSLVSRLSGSSSSKQAQPAQPGKVSNTTQSPGARDPSPSKAKQPAQLAGSSAKEAPSAVVATQGKPASGQVPSSTARPAHCPSQQSPLPVSSQQLPTVPGKPAVQPEAAPAVPAQRSTKSPIPSPQSPSAAVKLPAPKQNSAALSGKAAAASQSPAASNTPLASKLQLQSSPVAAPKPQNQSGSTDRVAASNGNSQAARLSIVSSPQPPLLATKSQASRQETLPIPLQASPQDPPIPGLASPEKLVTVHSVRPPSATGPSRPSGTASAQPEQVVSEPPSPWVPPPPAEAPPQPPQIPSDPYPPEPSSPRAAPAVGATDKKNSRSVDDSGVCDGPTPPSDSGEDMEIDEEAAPPLPTEPFPQGFELATINSDQELVEVSGEERDSLLNELSSIHVSNLYYSF